MPEYQKKPAHTPRVAEHEDALGESCGKHESDYAREAKYLAAVQDVKALGRRPVDWMKRELLAGAAGDDRRNWAQRKVLKNDPSFLLQSYDRMSGKDHKSTVREARVFDYLSRCHLLAMHATTEEGTTEYKAAARATVCTTSLYQTSTQIPHTYRFVRNSNVCINPWVCPHCYARKMEEAFQDSACRLEEQRPRYIALLSQTCSIALADEDLCKSERAAMRSSLHSTAEMLGGTGGLWTVQLGPVLEQKQFWAANEACYENAEELALRVAVMAYIPNSLASLTKLKQFCVGNYVAPPGVYIDLVEAGQVGGLRAVMVKCRNSSEPTVKLKNNPHGLFHWPTMTLCSPQQWHTRFHMTHSQKSVRKWGDWCRKRTARPRVKPRSRPQQRRERLLEAAGSILATSGYPAVPIPGRTILRKLLDDAGIKASERDVRWLIAQNFQAGSLS
ncbi:hypothetical protein [Allorhodopirellula heiligendammensis]|uniref:Uncharacterized protein n=1 Tax=Allorhodopirellula heiligendammensis TaxID=2714739 RepID=A0A5C6BVM7_9BACT|nr:hypothetical protein [Allorhodopirellula heiligendammensis]TWU15481.1 hypothetical protein Poly21_26770 [Allorhodopirellula heiligendammensis]